MINYIDDIYPERKDKEYTYVVWELSEHLGGGFNDSSKILGYYASKGVATMEVYKLPNSARRHFYIKSIGVR